MPRIRVCLLGPPIIELDGSPIQVDTRKAIALLIYLIVSKGQQPRDLLATLFWPDLDQKHARSTLRRTLSSLKHSLGGAGLIILRESIGIDPQADWRIDLEEFRKKIALTSPHVHSIDDCPRLISKFNVAENLVRGDFLSGFSLRDSVSFDNWQSLYSDTIRQEYIHVLEQLTNCHIYLGEYKQAIHYTRRSLAIEPLEEKNVRDLMRLYTWSGRRDAGLQQYHKLVQMLDTELQLIPSQETTALYTDILENNLVPPHIPRVHTEVQSYRDYLRSPALYPFVGRQKEFDQLLDAYENSTSFRTFAVIEGEVGVGKTRLAEEFLTQASQTGSVIISARFFQGEINPPYGPFVEGIRSAISLPGLVEIVASLPDLWKIEISRLIPEVFNLTNLGSFPSLSENSPIQARMNEAIERVIQWICQGPRPGILFLDDLQWADNASIKLLIYLLQKSIGQPLFILGIWRSEDIRPGHRLRDALVDAQRSGRGLLIRLDRLKQAEVAELLGSIPGKNYSGTIIGKLYQESEGLPYFLTEFLSVMNQLDNNAANVEFPLPSSVRELLDSRLAQLSPHGLALLSTAAVIGRSFEFDTLCKVSGQEAEVCIGPLEELLNKGLIQATAGRNEDEAISYDFVHDKLRGLVYEEISLPRRRLIHKNLAETLVKQTSNTDPSPLAGQIAFHYRLAGDTDIAAHYYFRAGEYARTIFAISDALDHFQTAKSLGYLNQAILQEHIGDLLTLMGAYAQAVESYQSCLLDFPSLHPALIYYKLAQVNHRLGDWNAADKQFTHALKHLEKSTDINLKVEVLVDRSLTVLYKDGLTAAKAPADEALTLAQNAKDARGLSQVYNILGILARREGQLDQAMACLEESLRWAEHSQDRACSIAALNNLALTCGEMDNFQQAILHSQKALELSALIGDRHREAALLSNLADFYYQSGEAETAMIHLKKSVAIFSEIGTPAGDIQAEIWKLTEW